MAKPSKSVERSSNESPITITKQIDINFRTYALYVLENRGIPGFYDALTNVQRVILMNTPKSFNKTISLVGSCISNGYHHGDASLQGAINKLTRPFSCSEQLLLGDGFFGTTVTPEASAARYTSVKMNPLISEILGKHSDLNSKNDEDQWEWLKTEIPIGLLTTIMGIAVGYKTSILPRKLEDIQKTLDGKKSKLLPYFKDFNGTVSSYELGKKSWLIEGVYFIDEKTKTIRVTEIPPLMKYDSFIKKLSKYMENSKAEFSIQNDTGEVIDITLKYKGGVSWDDFKTRVAKMTKLLVTETLIFVKDGAVIEYEDLIDYLSEFRVHREFVRLMQSLHDIKVTSEELEFLKAKVEYLKFMLAKKHSDQEIEIYLSPFPIKIKSRLERILLRDLSPEKLKETEQKVKDTIKYLIKENDTKDQLTTSHEQLLNDLPKRSKSTQNRSADLFMGEENEIDGIELFEFKEEEIDTDDFTEEDE